MGEAALGETGIDTATAGGVRTITINRPEVRNALHVAARLALRDALVAADADPAVGVIVLTGASGHFCSGGDVREFGRFQDEAEARRYAVEVAQAVFTTVRGLETPTVARVEGVAAGAGMFLALGCDVVVAAQDARFVATHLRLGVPPDWGAVWLLPRLVGMARAKLLLLTARPIDGPLAADWGLIATCVPSSQLDEAVTGVCRDLLSLPPGALSLTRRGVERSLDMELEEFLDWEATVMARSVVTPEHHTRVEAFLSPGGRA